MRTTSPSTRKIRHEGNRNRSRWYPALTQAGGHTVDGNATQILCEEAQNTVLKSEQQECPWPGRGRELSFWRHVNEDCFGRPFLYDFMWTLSFTRGGMGHAHRERVSVAGVGRLVANSHCAQLMCRHHIRFKGQPRGRQLASNCHRSAHIECLPLRSPVPTHSLFLALFPQGS